MSMPDLADCRVLWVTRPEEDAAALAAALRAMSIEPLVAPLLSVTFYDGLPLDLADVQAFLATSANGVRALARRTTERDRLLLAVGDATARTAQALGFTRVESAAGDVAALAGLVRRRLRPEEGVLLHAAATDVAGDLAGLLAAAGFRYRREVLYAARTADELAPEVERALADGRLGGVLLFSPRTAATLVRVLEAGPFAERTADLDCFCLSHSVADVAGRLAWRARVVAEHPAQVALLAAVREQYAASSRHSAVDSAPPTGYLSGTLTMPGRLAEHRHGGEGDGGMQNEDDKLRAAGGAHPGTSERPIPAASEREPATTPGPAGAEMSPPFPDTPAAKASGGVDEAADEAGRRVEPWGSVPPSAVSDDTMPAPSATLGPRGSAASEEAAKPARPKAPPPAPAKKSGSFARSAGITLAVLLVLAGAGGAVWYTQFYAKQPGQQAASPPEADPTADIVASLEALEARQARIRQQLDALAPRLDAVERALAQLHQSVESIGGGPAGVPQEVVDRIARLESQAATATSLAQHVRSLEGTVEAARDTAGKLASTVLAVGQLSQAMTTGGSFVRPLAAVRGFGGDDAEIAQAAVELEPFAGQGVPTLATLRARFPAVADAVVRAAPVTAGESWSDKVVDRVANLITIRRTGEGAIGTGGVDGTLADAEAALAGGDLQAAVTALKSLPGPALDAAQSWIEMAESRLAAERALATLQQRAIARLSQARG